MRLTIIFAIIGALLFAFGGYMHEQAHVQILKTYGIDSKIELFKYFPDFVTIPEEPCPNDECNLANHINEIVSYNLDYIYILLFTRLLIIIIILENILEIKWNTIEY